MEAIVAVVARWPRVTWAAIRLVLPRVELSMEVMEGRLEPLTGLRCCISRCTCATSPPTPHLALVELAPRQVGKRHLDGFAFDAVDETIADRAAHEEDEAEPGEAGRAGVPRQPLVHLVAVGRTVEDDDSAEHLGEREHSIYALQCHI